VISHQHRILTTEGTEASNTTDVKYLPQSFPPTLALPSHDGSTIPSSNIQHLPAAINGFECTIMAGQKTSPYLIKHACVKISSSYYR
jgi:hypothetical protein